MIYHFDYATGEMAVDKERPHGIEGRYWNSGGTAVAIVARFNPGADWAAYVGAAPSILATETETLVHVAAYGAKLEEDEARFFFPDIKEPYRG